jgi:hypothetical protein
LAPELIKIEKCGKETKPKIRFRFFFAGFSTKNGPDNGKNS